MARVIELIFFFKMIQLKMPLSQIQRTPLVPTRAQNHAFTPVHVTQQQGSGWTKPLSRQMGSHHRQPFAGPSMPISDYSYRSTTGSERSDSGNEVEKILIGSSSARITAGWGPAAARSESIDKVGYQDSIELFFL